MKRKRNIRENDNNNDGESREDSQELSNHIFYLPLGLLMGIVDSIPGFSGATIALLFKQYETIISKVSQVLSFDFIKKLLTLNITKIIRHDITILLLLFTGIGCGILLSFFTIASFFEKYEELTYKIVLFLMLLITIYYVFIHKKNFKQTFFKSSNILILLACWISFTSLFVLANSIQMLNNSALLFFIAGIFAITAMLLPGISGSLILVLFGVYVPLKDALLSLNYSILFSFIIGAGIGALLAIKVIGYYSKKYPIQIKYIILSVLLSAITLLIYIIF